MSYIRYSKCAHCRETIYQNQPLGRWRHWRKDQRGCGGIFVDFSAEPAVVGMEGTKQ